MVGKPADVLCTTSVYLSSPISLTSSQHFAAPLLPFEAFFVFYFFCFVHFASCDALLFIKNFAHLPHDRSKEGVWFTREYSTRVTFEYLRVNRQFTIKGRTSLQGEDIASMMI